MLRYRQDGRWGEKGRASTTSGILVRLEEVGSGYAGLGAYGSQSRCLQCRMAGLAREAMTLSESHRPPLSADSTATPWDGIMAAEPNLSLDVLDPCYPGFMKAIAGAYAVVERAERLADPPAFRWEYARNGPLCRRSGRSVVGFRLAGALLSPDGDLRPVPSPPNRSRSEHMFTEHGASSWVRS